MRFVSPDDRGRSSASVLRSLLPRARRALAAAAAALALAACAGDRAVPTEPVPVVPSLAQLTCTVTASTGTFSCASPTPSVSGYSADLIFGGQNVNVRLAQQSFTFDPATRVLSSVVQLTNLRSEAIGTSDGTTPSANGVRVFFNVAPSNGVTVINPDGTATFTASSQPFFQYAAPLAQNASASKTWQLKLPTGVDTFSFQVLISAATPSESPVGPAPKLVINEVMGDPSKVADTDGEWVEIYNPGGTAIDIKGYRIGSSNDTPHAIATSVIVPALGYVVLGRTTDTTKNGNVKVTYSYGTSITFNNSGTDAVWLRDASAGNGVTVDSVSLNANYTAGVAKGVIDPLADNTLLNGPNWANQTSTYGLGDRGTPGAVNNGTSTQPAGPVTSVTVSPATKTVAPGAVSFYTATARDANGTAATTTYTWATSDSTIATVTSTGQVTAVDNGTVMIFARSANGVQGSATLTVSTAPPSGPVTYRDPLQFGVPAGTPTGLDAGDDIRITRAQYVLEYNDRRHLPNWVAWDLNPTVFGPAQRCDCFSPDPLLPSTSYKVVTSDYTGSGYDRGHMVTSAQRTASDAENLTTFYLTNILPQAPENNQGPWAAQEIYLSDLARSATPQQVFVFSGGVFSNSPTYLTNSTGTRIPIPVSTWKIALVFTNGGTGLSDIRTSSDVRVIAINVPNTLATAAGIRNVPWQNYKTTVDQIEALTGYDFLSALPDNIETAVEATVDP